MTKKYQKIFYKINQQRDNLTNDLEIFTTKISNINYFINKIKQYKTIIVLTTGIILFFLIKRNKIFKIYIKNIIKLWNYWKITKTLIKRVL